MTTPMAADGVGNDDTIALRSDQAERDRQHRGREADRHDRPARQCDGGEGDGCEEGIHLASHARLGRRGMSAVPTPSAKA